LLAWQSRDPGGDADDRRRLIGSSTYPSQVEHIEGKEEEPVDE